LAQAVAQSWRRSVWRRTEQEISRKKLDSLLTEGDPEAAGVVQGAIEDFAQELALVTRRFLKLKSWRDTERIVVGGGLRDSRAGELIIGRAAVILKADKVPVDLLPIRNEPNDAGCARAGKEGLRLAPFIGIGCPGIIAEDGTIERGAQNLPGNWESKSFNLPIALQDAIPTIGEHDTVTLLHNDAVVQGLSEVPFMRDATRWGVLTIGTGLGNACFTNRNAADED
jgi:predicted NBD/HSP70 family sugar kinase